MRYSPKITSFYSVGIVALLLALMSVASPEDCAAYWLALVCGAFALTALCFVRNPEERRVLIRLFSIAFLLRLTFTWLIYRFNVLEILKSPDDAWDFFWAHSEYWRGSASGMVLNRTAFGPGIYPETFWDIYDGTVPRNKGFYYWGTAFYYFLGVPSQMALSFLNCFASSLSVLVIYRVSRDFFSEKASLFAATVATVMPGFLIWAATPVKESWIILLNITTFWAIWRYARDRSILHGLLGLTCIGLILGMRFYVAWVLAAAAFLSVICFRSARPARAAALTLLSLVFLYVLGTNFDMIHLNFADMFTSSLEDMTKFRTSVSAAGMKGNGSAISFDYDIRTPVGAAMMFLIGSAYLLLSPFPWQLTNIRQAATLPDLLLWWFLIFGFILPGLRALWRQYLSLGISLVTYLLPLLIFYALIFGNVGLAYRQRAQFMPFFLIVAAAGYDKRRQRAQLRDLGLSLNRAPRIGAPSAALSVSKTL